MNYISVFPFTADSVFKILPYTAMSDWIQHASPFISTAAALHAIALNAIGAISKGPIVGSSNPIVVLPSRFVGDIGVVDRLIRRRSSFR